VTVRLDAHPDLEFRGKVKAVQRTVQRSSPRLPLKVARLDVALDKVDTQRKRPGMRARGRVEIERARGVLVVPVECVVVTAQGPAVYRKGAAGVARVPISVGRRNESRVEVVSGLSEGETVLQLAAAQGGNGKTS
jgi:hypothetical protein